MQSTLPSNSTPFPIRAILGVFKLRIGVVITFTALAGLAVSPGPSLSLLQLLVLTLSVLVSSASAGAFNQYYEHDSDHLMARTSKRPFVTGELRHGPIWLLVIAALMTLSVGAAWIALNAWSALFVFLGAFFYAIVYTVWLKRRTWLNIVFGGLAGSWAVLAGATAADPHSAPCRWRWHWSSFCGRRRISGAWRSLSVTTTPPPACRCCRSSSATSKRQTRSSSAPWRWLPPACCRWPSASARSTSPAPPIGGFLFIQKAWLLTRDPNRKSAMVCFHASLIQLTLVLWPPSSTRNCGF
jgi:protoheme IX farnesyltransferase